VRAEGASLVGIYRLTLVAATGAGAGRSITGDMFLRPDHRPEVQPGVTWPAWGFANLDHDAVGAIAAGDIASGDSLAPGVRVIQQSAGGPAARVNRIVLRLGSDANREGSTRFDGAYLALFVDAVNADGFAGHWQSGESGGERVRGHFCARRAAID
jgi:hypothetical protein